MAYVQKMRPAIEVLIDKNIKELQGKVEALDITDEVEFESLTKEIDELLEKKLEERRILNFNISLVEQAKNAIYMRCIKHLSGEKSH
jgi:hypothetical protein